MTAIRADKPLSQRDIDALDALLAAIPDDSDPMDVAVLDGYLVGVLLQPVVVDVDAWLPLVFATDGQAVELSDPEAMPRARALILRRYNELAACIAGREPFDPIVFDATDDAGQPLEGKAGIAALVPWVTGFVVALDAFPGLADASDDDGDLDAEIAAILRHLALRDDGTDDTTDEDRAAYAEEQAELDRERPLADIDDALDDLVSSVLDIADITRPNRPVTRTMPKVGRNDPCPCGSGRKYKACHGNDS